MAADCDTRSFIGQTPICLVAFIAVYFVLQLPRRTDAPVGSSHWAAKVAKIDFLGAVVLVSAVFSLLLGLDAGSNVGWSSVPHTIVPLLLAPVLFAIFLLVEIKVASHPFAPGHVILDSSMFAAYLANFFGVAGHIGPIFFLPLFYQAVDGFGATEAGLLLIPGMVAAVCASIGGGLIIRHTGRYYWVTVLSFGLLLLSIVPLVMFTGLVANSIVGITIGLIMLTLGAGSGITTTLVALISNAAQEDSAVAIACSYLFRSLGTSIGISAASAVLQQTLRTRLVEKLRDLPPDLGGGGEDRAREIEERVRQNLEYIGTLEPAVAAIVRRCYAVATQAAFVTSAAFLVCAFVSTWWIKEKRLGK